MLCKSAAFHRCSSSSLLCRRNSSFEWCYFTGGLQIYDKSGRVPSNITRAIYEYYNPEPTVKAFINNQLYLNKRVGFYLLLIGGLIQLFTIWLE